MEDSRLKVHDSLLLGSLNQVEIELIYAEYIAKFQVAEKATPNIQLAMTGGNKNQGLLASSPPPSTLYIMWWHLHKLLNQVIVALFLVLYCIRWYNP